MNQKRPIGMSAFQRSRLHIFDFLLEWGTFCWNISYVECSPQTSTESPEGRESLSNCPYRGDLRPTKLASSSQMQFNSTAHLHFQYTRYGRACDYIKGRKRTWTREYIFRRYDMYITFTIFTISPVSAVHMYLAVSVIDSSKAGQAFGRIGDPGAGNERGVR
jgi:hypothetical protein